MNRRWGDNKVRGIRIYMVTRFDLALAVAVGVVIGLGLSEMWV